MVTDRLHGMIFAYLAGTPCVFLDNKTKKVSGVYNTWLKYCVSIQPFSDSSDISFIERFISNAINNEIVDGISVDTHKFDVLKKEVLKNEKWN